MTSMYRGTRKFDREQLIFVIEATLCGALDRIESSLPDTIPLAEYNEHEDGIKSWVMAAKETAGMTLAILWAQLNNDGLGAGDALEVVGFEKVVADFVAERTDPDWPGSKEGDKSHPDCRPLAEIFVDKMFDQYLLPYSDVGYEIEDNGGYYSWPEEDGTIRLYDDGGDRRDVIKIGDGAWGEIRDLFPDDALYYQPEDTTVADIPSFLVYRNRANAEKAHPDCEIIAFTGDDIQAPKFADVEEPTRFFTKPD
jgi:hypothetical protein